MYYNYRAAGTQRSRPLGSRSLKNMRINAVDAPERADNPPTGYVIPPPSYAPCISPGNACVKRKLPSRCHGSVSKRKV
jgi:hypothetical protein